MTSNARLAGLDAARAIAVLAMVMGHSLDAVLSPAARALPALTTYWAVRTFTAPLFLVVSGWAVMTSLSRLELRGGQVLRRYLPRVVLLFGLGFLLRFPAWDVAGLFRLDRMVWQHFLAFDALHCIAASLLIGTVVLALTPVRGARGAVLMLMAAAIVLLSPLVWAALAKPEAPLVLKQTLGGGDSPFPFFPWAAFFFAGAAVGMLSLRLARPEHRIILLLALGVLAIAATGNTPTTHMARNGLLLYAWRLGGALVVLAFALMLPQRWAQAMAPIGRASLWVYVIHLPVAYGWALWPGLSTRIGPTLAPLPALGVALGVTVVSVAVALGGKKVRGLWRRRGAAAGSPGQDTPGANPNVSTAERPVGSILG